MKKTIVNIFAIALVLNACNNANKTEMKTNESAKDTIQTSNLQVDTSKVTAAYACPMHPEVTSDTLTTCSKCGMDLEKK